MSRLLHLLNQLKTEARADFLTPTQVAAANKLDDLWRFPERVNLVGPHGAGKTFLGWAIARSKKGVFVSSPEKLLGKSIESASPAVVDNISVAETRLRTLLAELQLNQLRKVLLISREPNHLGLPIVELELPTLEDINVVYHHLSILECYALEPISQGNLWEVIFSTLMISHRRDTP